MGQWFSDKRMDRLDDQKAVWEPVLEEGPEGGGMCFPFPMWFKTKEQCDAFIDRELVGAEREDAP